MLRLVIPKGSLEKATLDLFEAADLPVVRSSSVDYKASIDDPRIADVRILRPQEIPTYVAEGLFDSLGVQVEDEHGLVVVAGQKAEVTRISDTNGDGLADKYETLSDAFTYTGNYHAYMHGPVRDAQGKLIAGLGISVPSARVAYDALAGFRQPMEAAAAEIAAAIAAAQ